MKISTLEKTRAPSGFLVRKGLDVATTTSTSSLPRFLVENRDGDFVGEPAALRLKNTDNLKLAVILAKPRIDFALKSNRIVGSLEDHDLLHSWGNLHLLNLRLSRFGRCRRSGSAVATDQNEAEKQHRNYCQETLHVLLPPQGTRFSRAKLPQRLPVSCDSDNGFKDSMLCHKSQEAASATSWNQIRMIKKFSSPKMRNRQFVFAPKIQYKLVAERSEANQNSLTFPTWCSREDSNL